MQRTHIGVKNTLTPPGTEHGDDKSTQAGRRINAIYRDGARAGKYISGRCLITSSPRNSGTARLLVGAINELDDNTGVHPCAFPSPSSLACQDSNSGGERQLTEAQFGHSSARFWPVSEYEITGLRVPNWLISSPSPASFSLTAWNRKVGGSQDISIVSVKDMSYSESQALRGDSGTKRLVPGT